MRQISAARVANSPKTTECWRRFLFDQYVSREELRADVFDYIEMFYNPRRRHSTLGQISPVEFERLYSVHAK
jgi:transposase InsO family protein